MTLAVEIEKLNNMLEAMQMAEQDLRDYHWMNALVIEYKNRQKTERDEIGITISKYGLDASLPRSSGISSPTEREVLRLLREYERIKRYEEKLKRIDEAVSQITDERERAVAEAIMDGERLYRIAQQIGVSKTKVYELRKSVIRHLALKLYREMFA